MFAPVVAIEFSTPAPKAVAAITATVTQADGESAIKTFDVEFPKPFGFNERFQTPRCQEEEEAAEACPAESRIGSVSADSQFGPATGEVFIADDMRLLVFATAVGGAIKIKAVGSVEIGKLGGFAISFAGLPDLPLRRLTLAFEGDDLGLLKNPARCKTWKLPTRIVSHEDDVVELDQEVPITGCPPALGVSALKAVTAGARATVGWSVTEAAEQSDVRLTRGGDVVARRRVTATSTTFRNLKAGRYRVRVRALAGERVSRPKYAAFRIG